MKYWSDIKPLAERLASKVLKNEQLTSWRHSDRHPKRSTEKRVIKQTVLNEYGTVAHLKLTRL